MTTLKTLKTPELYRMHWKSEHFTNASSGPILRHSKNGNLKKGRPYTQQEALLTCFRFNKQGERIKALRARGGSSDHPYVKHWVEPAAKGILT